MTPVTQTEVATRWRNSDLAGISYALLGVGFFSIVFVSAKILGDPGFAWQIMFLRYVSGFVCLTGIGLARFRYVTPLRSTRWRFHMLRAVCSGAGGSAGIFAAASMPVADAAAIGLLSGIIAFVLGLVVFREVLTRNKLSAIIISFIGAMVAVVGNGAFQTDPTTFLLPAMIALAGAGFIAVEVILIKMLASTERSFLVLLYVNFFGMLFFAVPALLNWRQLDYLELGLLLLLGPIALIAQLCNIIAYSKSDVSIVSPTRYSLIAFTALIGWVFFKEIPALTTILGGLIIIFGGYFLTISRTKVADSRA